MKVQLPFILCFYTEISEDSSLVPFEIAFLSKKIEILFFLRQCYNPTLSKLFKQKKGKKKKA